MTLKRLGSSLGGTFATAIEETTQKLLRSSDRRTEVSMEPSSSWRSDSRRSRWTMTVERVFEQLQSAERDRRRVQFGYTDKKGAGTQRRVDPYGFIVSNGRVYLVATTTTAPTCGCSRSTTYRMSGNAADLEKPADFNLEAYGGTR